MHTNEELKSNEVEEILNKVPSWMIRRGNMLFLVLLILLLLTSWFVKYPDIVVAKAIITTEEPPQKEYAKITGKIDTIFVKNNEQVSNHTPIAIIENTANYQDVFFLKSVLDTITIQKNTFSFPLDSLPILFLGDIEESYTKFENAYLAYTLNKKLQPFSNEIVANNMAKSELKNRLTNLFSQKKIYQAEIDFQYKDVARSKQLFEKGVISAKSYEAKQLEYLQAKRKYQDIDAAISQVKVLLAGNTKTNTGTKISRKRNEIALLKGTLQAFNELKRAVKNWQLQYVFISRINGNVSFLNYWSKNQTVQQGNLVFTVIPTKKTPYIAKLKTPMLNSGKIKVGQTVNVRLENYPDYEFGVLKGTVNSISKIPDEKGMFMVDVALPKKLITTYKKQLHFTQEMSGKAEIITENLRLIERLFYQITKSLRRS